VITQGDFRNIGNKPSSLHTSLALRQAIWRKEDPRWIVCGIPDVLYTDHGSDFTSHHQEQVSADLKIRLVFSLPGKPRGRGRIERFFSTVNEMFLCELEGYAPAGGAVRGKPILTLSEFDARFRSFLLCVYHHRECSETKTPPVERWEANGFLPRMPDSLEQLDLLLIQVAKARQVRIDGINFQSLRYISATLAAYVGETVTLRFDPRDMAEIRVFHNERFLCRAVCGTGRRNGSTSRDSPCPESAAARSARRPAGPASCRRYAAPNEARRNQGERRCATRTRRQARSKAIRTPTQALPERIATANRP
jgi:Mu transposase, C-terminal